MRILMASNHRYPCYGAVGSGRHPKDFPSGSPGHIQDLLARGLAELGHDVFYLLPRGSETPLPQGVHLVSEPVADIDICQATTVPDAQAVATEFCKRGGYPWVLSCHLDRSADGEPARNNWIFVARALARTYGKDRFVLNGIDPANCSYSAAKEDFVLFMATAENADTKGIRTAITLSRRTGVRLVVAGSGRSYQTIGWLADLCREAGVDYLGDIRGSAKAEWLAAAKAVVLPTRANEGCPLSLLEALMSGTPVIASRAGGIPEVVTPETGFLCDTEDDYVRAVESLDQIVPSRCRQYALENFHYLRMVRDYVSEFELEIARHQGADRSRTMAT